MVIKAKLIESRQIASCHSFNPSSMFLGSWLAASKLFPKSSHSWQAVNQKHWFLGTKHFLCFRSRAHFYHCQEIMTSKEQYVNWNSKSVHMRIIQHGFCQDSICRLNFFFLFSFVEITWARVNHMFWCGKKFWRHGRSWNKWKAQVLFVFYLFRC